MAHTHDVHNYYYEDACDLTEMLNIVSHHEY